jgi:hypothetical protein
MIILHRIILASSESLSNHSLVFYVDIVHPYIDAVYIIILVSAPSLMSTTEEVS